MIQSEKPINYNGRNTFKKSFYFEHFFFMLSCLHAFRGIGGSLRVVVGTQVRCGSFRQSNLPDKDDSFSAKDVHDDFVKRVWLKMPKEKPQFTPEEAKIRITLGKRKVMNELREHNTRQKAEMIRIKLKWSAVNALPTPCREAAMISDNTRFPDLPLLMDYPPKLKDPDNPEDWKPRPRKRWKFINNFRD